MLTQKMLSSNGMLSANQKSLKAWRNSNWAAENRESKRKDMRQNEDASHYG